MIDKCEVCGAVPPMLTELLNGDTYCQIHKGLAAKPPEGAEVAAPPEVAETHLQVERGATRGVIDGPNPHVHDDLPEEAPPAVVADVPETPGVPKATRRRKPRSKGAQSRMESVERTEGEPNMDALKLIIGLTLRAGLASLDDDNEPLEPPTGWLPPPASDVPEAEAGAALAIALLIRTFGIAHDDVRALALPFLESTTGEETPQ